MIHESYAWSAGDRGGREAMLRFGSPDWPTILIIPPLFEEANRMRRVLVSVMRTLADDMQIGSVLPDLPGTGDSCVATVDARLGDWAAAIGAVAALLPVPRMTVAIRGGALLDRFADADARWRLAPETGTRVLRDLFRSTALSAGLTAAEVEDRAKFGPTHLAGNLVHPDLVRALEAAELDSAGDVRTASLDDRGDVQIAGSPVWRRVEPGDDWSLVSGMSEDIYCWVNRCVAR